MGIRNRLEEIQWDLRIKQDYQMAELIGVPREQYSRYKHNKIQPSGEIMLRIAKNLNRPVEEIFYIEEPPE